MARVKEIPATTELLCIFGKQDNHVPLAGRTLIRRELDEADVKFSWLELQTAAHAFVRDEDLKGRYDPAVTQICITMLLELFSRTLY